jgi:hypothetical protein
MCGNTRLALACGLVANRLLRVITVGLKDLPAVKATAIHWAAPEKNERGSFSLEPPLNLVQPAKEFSAHRVVDASPLMVLLLSKPMCRMSPFLPARQIARSPCPIGAFGPKKAVTIMWSSAAYRISESFRQEVG